MPTLTAPPGRSANTCCIMCQSCGCARNAAGERVRDPLHHRHQALVAVGVRHRRVERDRHVVADVVQGHRHQRRPGPPGQQRRARAASGRGAPHSSTSTPVRDRSRSASRHDQPPVAHPALEPRQRGVPAGQRQDLHAEGGAVGHELVVEPLRLEPLRHGQQRHPGGARPGAGPVPVAHVRQGYDDPAARRRRRRAGGARRRCGCVVRRPRSATRAAGTTRTSSAGRTGRASWVSASSSSPTRSGRTRARLARSRCTPRPSRR